MILLRVHHAHALFFLLVAGIFLARTVATADAQDTPPTAPADTEIKAATATERHGMFATFVDYRTRMKEEVLQMTDFFDTRLPGTLKKFNLVLSVSPRGPDLRDNEFVRIPFTLRYGLSDRWEMYGGLTPYMPNPFKNGDDHRWGLGQNTAGLRYNWGTWGKVFDHVTVGFEERSPVGKPPADIIDYHTHLIPYINTSRALPFPSTTFYLSFTYDRSVGTPWRTSAPPEILRSHVFSVTPSVLYKPGEFGGSFEYNFRHFEDERVGTHLAHEFKPGLIWDVPLWRTQSWGLPGKWQIDLGYRVTLEEGRDLVQRPILRVRWRTTVHEVFSKSSYERKPRP